MKMSRALRFACFILACFAGSSFAVTCERNLTTHILCPSEKNNCSNPINGSYVNLVYTTAVGLGDVSNTIHYLYSTRGIPSVLVARTCHKAVLLVNYSKLINGTPEEAQNSIKFVNGTIEEVTVIMLNQLMDYQDLHDTNNLMEANQTTRYNLSEAVWKNARTQTDGDHHVVLFEMSVQSQNPPLQENGTVALRFQALCSAGYNVDLPNLQYNSNNSFVDVILDRVLTRYPESRLALNMIYASNKNIEQDMAVAIERSIDDEHSPGSFLTINWLNGNSRSSSSSYVQWKPACFSSAARSMQNTLSHVHNYNSTRYNFTSPQLGLAFDFFGDNLTVSHVDRNVNVFALNVSFGLSKDKFYSSSAYIVWSFSVGLGLPPSSNGISIMIILILAVGLGIPVVLLLAGGAYRCLRKYRRHYGYTDITDSYAEIN